MHHDFGGGGAGVPDHSRGRRHRRAGAQHRRPGVGRRAGQDADDSLGVLVIERPGHRPAGSDVSGVECHQGGRGKVQTDVDDFDPAAVGECVHGFSTTKGHGERGTHRRPRDRPGRHVDATRNVDGDHGNPGRLGGGKYLGGRWSQRTLPRNSDNPVNHQISCCGQVLGHLAASGPECTQSTRVGSLWVEQDRGGGHAAAAQKSRRPQGIPAVGPGAHHRADAAAGDPPGALTQFGGDDMSQTRCRTAHERAIRQRGQQGRLSHANLIGGVVVPHQSLFHRDGFGEIPRLVDVVATCLGYRRREDLQGDR